MKAKIHIWRSLVIFAFLLAPVSASADAVADWNLITVQTTITGGRPGPTGVLDLAVVHAAIYDAVQAIEKRYQPYYVEIPGASGSPVAAAAKAAHDVLVNRFPAQAGNLDLIYEQYLANHGLSNTDPGIAVGAKAAAGIIALRNCDGSFPTVAQAPFVGGTAPGEWRPTPPANLPMLAPWLGQVTPFTLIRPTQFPVAPPPQLQSAQYLRDYDEVKALGAVNSTLRTPDQTDMAHFYAGNTVVIWNQVFREVASAHVHNIADSSRLFALADMATADAVIATWNNKTRYAFWRPITAIREGDNDGNSRTVGDSGWTPLLTTPNYPDYTSGANAFAAAATQALALIFGTDNMTFSVTTTNVGPTVQDTRTYLRFSDAQQDVEDARIYTGIHFRFADEAARKQGNQVAEWAFNHFFRENTEE